MTESYTETFCVDHEDTCPPMRVGYRATVEVDLPDYPGGLGNAEVISCTPVLVEVYESNFSSQIYVEEDGDLESHAPKLDDEDVISLVIDRIAMRDLMNISL